MNDDPDSLPSEYTTTQRNDRARSEIVRRSKHVRHADWESAGDILHKFNHAIPKTIRFNTWHSGRCGLSDYWLRRQQTPNLELFIFKTRQLAHILRRIKLDRVRIICICLVTEIDSCNLDIQKLLKSLSHIPAKMLSYFRIDLCSILFTRGALKNLRNVEIQNLSVTRSLILKSSTDLFAKRHQLQSLNLSGNHLNSDEAKKIAHSICWPNLQSLDLSFNCIGDEGAKHFGQNAT